MRRRVVKVQVRRIDIIGNEQTADEVIRREFLQLEQEVYSRAKIESSRRRLRRLGYFRDVRVEIQRIAEADDQVDLIITVDEGGLGDIPALARVLALTAASLLMAVLMRQIFSAVAMIFVLPAHFRIRRSRFLPALTSLSYRRISRHFASGYGENNNRLGRVSADIKYRRRCRANPSAN